MPHLQLLRAGSTIRAVPALLAVTCIALVVQACDHNAPTIRQQTKQPPRSESAVYQAEIDEGIGAGIVILIDTSGSMKESAPGDTRPKWQVARAAIKNMLNTTDAFAKKRPDFAIKVGIMHFSSKAWIDLPIRAHDVEQQRAALDRVPQPGGGTAIGAAMRLARQELYRSGVFRKYLIVVTDGENTSGPDPARIASEIHRRSEGSVVMYFVAFDTSATKFSFLADVGGAAVEARNGSDLEAKLKEIYEGKILAEAVDYGESDTPAKSR